VTHARLDHQGWCGQRQGWSRHSPFESPSANAFLGKENLCFQIVCGDRLSRTPTLDCSCSRLYWWFLHVFSPSFQLTRPVKPKMTIAKVALYCACCRWSHLWWLVTCWTSKLKSAAETTSSIRETWPGLWSKIAVSKWCWLTWQPLGSICFGVRAVTGTRPHWCFLNLSVSLLSFV